MQRVASYIMTMQGTNPSNGKAAEGEKYVPEGDAPAPVEKPEENETENI